MQTTTKAVLLGRRTILSLFGVAAATCIAGEMDGFDPFRTSDLNTPQNWPGAARVANAAGRPPWVHPQPSQTPPVSVPSPLLPPRRVTRRTAVLPEDLAEWHEFKRRFVLPDGRIIDTGNGSVSHSEGQGWGMLFAVAFDDPATFDLIYGWTQRVLRRANDHLHAWRYLPAAQPSVPDSNNATDADLFIAAALWRAAWQWGRQDFAQAAGLIARDILSNLVRTAGNRTVLIPGASGFETAAALTVNPSYYAFPFLEEMESLFPSPKWGLIRTDGRSLISEAKFGHWGLPPDWLHVDRKTGALAPHPNWPARFSYDAIRIPLWLAWSGEKPSVTTQSFQRYWARHQSATPAWVDLNTDASATYPAPSGMVAIARIATVLTQPQPKAELPAGFPTLHASPDYYSAALIILSRLAWRETRDMA